MIPPSLKACIANVPAGSWAVAVSGGADSVALLLLLHERVDLSLHVVHLDHETRAGESALDGAFVADLARRLNLPCTIKRRSEFEPTVFKLPKNISARFRAIRTELFKEVVSQKNLSGVILAHHAADQAETVLQRLLRGSGVTALTGMSEQSTLAGLKIFRPLLTIHPQMFRDYLKALDQSWREDSSNASPQYQRNRVRSVLNSNSDLQASLVHLAKVNAAWRSWVLATTPTLSESFSTTDLADLPLPHAAQAAVKWLQSHRCPADEITTDVRNRLVEMTTDAATSAHQQFPGNLHVHRRGGMISVERGDFP